MNAEQIVRRKLHPMALYSTRAKYESKLKKEEEARLTKIISVRQEMIKTVRERYPRDMELSKLLDSLERHTRSMQD